jgi:hypothetical protein
MTPVEPCEARANPFHFSAPCLRALLFAWCNVRGVNPTLEGAMSEQLEHASASANQLDAATTLAALHEGAESAPKRALKRVSRRARAAARGGRALKLWA